MSSPKNPPGTRTFRESKLQLSEDYEDSISPAVAEIPSHFKHRFPQQPHRVQGHQAVNAPDSAILEVPPTPRWNSRSPKTRVIPPGQPLSSPRIAGIVHQQGDKTSVLKNLIKRFFKNRPNARSGCRLQSRDGSRSSRLTTGTEVGSSLAHYDLQDWRFTVSAGLPFSPVDR